MDPIQDAKDRVRRAVEAIRGVGGTVKSEIGDGGADLSKLALEFSFPDNLPVESLPALTNELAEAISDFQVPLKAAKLLSQMFPEISG